MRIEQNLELKRILNESQTQVQNLKREKESLLEQNRLFKLNLSVNKEGILEYQMVNAK